MTPFKAMCYFVATGLNYGVYLFLITYALQSSLRYSKKATSILIIGTFLVGACLDILCFEIDSPFPQYLIIGKIAITVWEIIGASIILKKSGFQILFGCFMIITTQSNVIAIAETLTDLAPMPIIAPSFPNMNYLVYTLMVLLLFSPFLYFLFCKVMRRTMELGIEPKLWKVLFLLPMIYSIYGTCSGYGGAKHGAATYMDLVSLVLMNVFAFSTYLTAMKMIIYSYDKYEISNRAEAAAHQLTLERARYEMLSEHIRENDRLIHDWRHHMVSFRDYVAKEDIKGLNKYLDKIGEKYTPQQQEPICEKSAVDVVLRHYLGLAKEIGVKITHHVEIPNTFNRSDLDLCIVFWQRDRKCL